ncbi:hypothetical protein BU15DRAFT_64934 [Melanogaster broomeanus]|nr:hypothetical protein BU15DRAFT_64934 [Melanogaster broomeanus]
MFWDVVATFGMFLGHLDNHTSAAVLVRVPAKPGRWRIPQKRLCMDKLPEHEELSAFMQNSCAIVVGLYQYLCQGVVPVTGPNTWPPEPILCSDPHASVFPPFPIPWAHDSQPPHTPTNRQGGHGLGLLQPDPQLPFSLAGYSSLLQGPHRRNRSRKVCPMTTPYTTYIAPSFPNGSFQEINPQPSVCGWRSSTDDSLCQAAITWQTVPQHLAVHGIRNMASNEPIRCRWCPDGTDPIKRGGLVRHIREVHLRVQRRATT